MKKTLLFTVFMLFGFLMLGIAQCINGSLYPSNTLTIPSNGSVLTISTCNYTNEYSNLTGVVSGESYYFTCLRTNTHKYLTITNATNGVLAHGMSPFTWTSSLNGDIRVHWSENDLCNTTSECHNTTVQKVCLNTTPYPSGTVSVPTDESTVSISTCSYTTEYSNFSGAVSGEIYEFSCTISGTHKYVTVTDIANNVLASGISPFSWTASLNGSFRVHWTDDMTCGGTSSCHTTTVTCSSCISSNDNCANAEEIFNGVTAFSTLGYTGSNESSCGSTGDINDGWYVYTASCTGDVTVSTCSDASFDTTLAAFDGCGGAELACNDDSSGCSGNTSEITFSVVSGNQYWIRIAGYNETTGTGNITIDCAVLAPENDECVNAISVSNPSSTAGTTINATTTGAPPICITSVNTGGVWYSYTSSVSEEVTISLCGAPYDSKIGVYTGSCGSFSCIIGEDDDFTVCGNDDPSVTFTTTTNFAPVTYYIYVHGYNGAQGTFTMELQAILPVELASFEGEIMKDYNLLLWETSSEANTEMHQIERSINGRDSWKLIGEVAAAGTSSEAISYSLKDANPLPVAYYRLKSVDFGGYTDYSEIILLQRKTDKIRMIGIAPNPTTDLINIDFFTPAADTYTLTITNMVGQTVMKTQQYLEEGNQRQNLDLGHLGNGIYLLTISNETRSTVHKIIKQ